MRLLRPVVACFALSMACSANHPPAHDGGADSAARDASVVDVSTDVTVLDVPSPSDADTPIIPVGLDAWRQWDRLAYVRIGARTYLQSTYDRAGGNEGADASHFVRLASTDEGIAADVTGPGVLYFVRTNHWHGSPWHYVIDGADHIVTESSTTDPDHPVAGSVFLPSAAFSPPLALTWSLTQGTTSCCSKRR